VVADIAQKIAGQGASQNLGVLEKAPGLKSWTPTDPGHYWDGRLGTGAGLPSTRRSSFARHCRLHLQTSTRAFTSRMAAAALPNWFSDQTKPSGCSLISAFSRTGVASGSLMSGVVTLCLTTTCMTKTMTSSEHRGRAAMNPDDHPGDGEPWVEPRSTLRAVGLESV